MKLYVKELQTCTVSTVYALSRYKFLIQIGLLH